MDGKYPRRKRLWCSNRKFFSKKRRSSGEVQQSGETVNDGDFITHDSLSDNERVSRGDCQYVFYKWDDLDQQFWGDDEKDSDSSDFQVSCTENGGNCGVCFRCRKPILSKLRYCTRCCQDRWQWIPQKPTRILRKKTVQKRKEGRLKTISDSSHDSLFPRRFSDPNGKFILPLSRYTNLPSSRKYVFAILSTSSTESSSFIE